MRIIVDWDISDELRNELLQYLTEFELAHPGCQFTAFVQSAPVETMTAFLREPTSSATQILGHGGPSKPQLSPLEGAMAAIEENPGQPARALAKRIGVSHQTVLRAQEALRSATAPLVVQGRTGRLRP